MRIIFTADAVLPLKWVIQSDNGAQFYHLTPASHDVRHTRPLGMHVEIRANNKLDSAGIAIWRGGLNDGRYGFIIL